MRGKVSIEKEDFKVFYEKIPDEIFRKRIQSVGDRYIEKAVHCRQTFYFWSVLGIVSPLTACGFLAFGENGELIRILAIICLLTASMSASMLSFTRCREKWSQYRKNIESMKRILSLYWAGESCDNKVTEGERENDNYFSDNDRLKELIEKMEIFMA